MKVTAVELPPHTAAVKDLNQNNGGFAINARRRLARINRRFIVKNIGSI